MDRTNAPQRTSEAFSVSKTTTAKSADAKRERLYNSRLIRADINDPAFTNPPRGKNIERKVIESQSVPNKLDVPAFVNARANEIMVLEQAMAKSKSAGAARIFQSLPRSMRRRTASHNVKRVPKRMRWKALKEMGVTGAPDVPLGTKGVTRAGRPTKPKLGRGRQRYTIERRVKLLQYALKHKISGKLLDGSWVDLKGVKVGDKIKMLRNELATLKAPPKAQPPVPASDASLIDRHRYAAAIAMTQLQNKTSAYDNTAVNEIAKIHRVTSLKYATRQRDHKWTPTHVWHAKRAKIIKRWGWSIPYSPTQKCFRNTSRASRQVGALVQDTSYYGTTVISGPEKDLQAFAVALTNGIAGRGKWLRLAWEGLAWVDGAPIGTVQTLWANSGDDTVTQLVLRSHPAIHTRLYAHTLLHFKDSQVSVQDCRYSIGSIALTGPKAITVLQTVLHPREKASPAFESFLKLFKLNDVNTVPEGTAFELDAVDPRLWTNNGLQPAPTVHENVLDLIISLRNSSLNGARLFDIDARSASYRNQPSNKQMDARRREHLGEPVPILPSDPSIPVVVYKTGATWSLLLPWFWVQPFWYTIMHTPHVQLCCLKQAEQLLFERSRLGWGDIVFTSDGFIQCQIEHDLLKAEWQKRPRSKRVAYEKLRLSPSELGETLSPFGLDWRGLQIVRLAVWRIAKFGTGRENNGLPSKDSKLNLIPETDSHIYPLVRAIQTAENQLKEVNNHSILVDHMPIELCMGESKLSNRQDDLCFNIVFLPPLGITPIKFECVHVGHIKPNARIYELPKEQVERLQSPVDPLELSIVGRLPKHRPFFDVPHIKHLVGLVSSATFNLTAGKSTGVGYIDTSFISSGTRLLVRNVASDKPVQITWSSITV